ncbi:MAG: flippase-like domain-containing protein [Gemmatimonadaceae bacterium]|nr:flippase-like domain-containing protein [Chitinophagaceae bacterium]
MNKKILNLVQYMVFLGIGIFLVWWSIGKISHKDWLDIKGAWLQANYWLILPVVLALLISHFSRAVRWKILMQPLGYNPSILNTYLAVLVGYFANLAVPRLGEVLKCTILSRYEKVPADKLVGTIVAERAFDMVCLVIVVAITIFTQVDIIGGFASEMFGKMLGGGGGPAWWKILIVVAALAIMLVLLKWFFKKFAHINLVQKIKNVIRNIWHGLTSIRYLQNKGWFLFHTALIWILYLASIRIGMYAMQETSGYGMKESLSVLTMGSIGMIATQGGIGAYPVLVQETMMLYGLSENMGKAFGWLLWLVQFFMVLLAGAASLVILPAINRKKKNEKHIDHQPEDILEK